MSIQLLITTANAQLFELDLDVFQNYTSTSSTLTIPSSFPVGGLMFFIDNAYLSGTTHPSLYTPPGFTNLLTVSTNSGASSIRHTVSYKILQSSDPGSTLNYQNTATYIRHHLACFSNSANKAISSVEFSDVNKQATTNAPIDQTIGKTGKKPYWNFAYWRGDGSITKTGTNMQFYEIGSTSCILGLYKSNNLSEVISVTSNDSGAWTALSSFSFSAMTKT